MLKIFCQIDDFVKTLRQNAELKILLKGPKKQRLRSSQLTLSERMTILVSFHQSRFRDFKSFYMLHVSTNLKKEFPQLISYSRFVRLMPDTLIALMLFLDSKLGKSTGISFIDSTPVKICHNKRINRNKTFEGLAKRGKSTMGWFYGFKLHFTINDRGEMMSYCLTPANTDDRTPLNILTKKLHGKLFGDKGYISKEKSKILLEKGVQLITSIKSNMKNKLMPYMDKILLRKRFLIETINDLLKNQLQIEHTRHRSSANFLVNLVSGLVAYTFNPKKPALNVNYKGQKMTAA
mgnify:CR=1 FL=1|jgi:hypothetical protein